MLKNEDKNLLNKEMNSQLRLMQRMNTLILLHCTGLALMDSMKLCSCFYRMELSNSFQIWTAFSQ